MTQDNKPEFIFNISIKQNDQGKEWEQRIITRVLKLTIYVPKGALDANKIRAVNKSTLIRYIETEGYGK